MRWVPRRSVLLGLAAAPVAAMARSDRLVPSAATNTANGISPLEFGAKFDGQSDDSKAIQDASDWAHSNGRTVDLPGRTAVLMTPLSLIDRQVNLRGAGMALTILRAGRQLPTLIDVRGDRDILISPFRIEDLTLDGGHKTDCNLAIRYRHNFELRSVISQGATT